MRRWGEVSTTAGVGMDGRTIGASTAGAAIVTDRLMLESTAYADGEDTTLSDLWKAVGKQQRSQTPKRDEAGRLSRYDFTPRLFPVVCGPDTHYLRLTPPGYVEVLHHWTWELVAAELAHTPVACAKWRRALRERHVFQMYYQNCQAPEYIQLIEIPYFATQFLDFSYNLADWRTHDHG
jgi:hypothetical protein